MDYNEIVTQIIEILKQNNCTVSDAEAVIHKLREAAREAKV